MVNFKISMYAIINKIKEIIFGKKADDFDWKLYNLHYRGEMEEGFKIHTLALQSEDYILKDEHLLKNKESILPLHPNHRLLYETILQLNPSSVMEIGCGGGDHLYNLSVLRPKIKLYGVDIAAKQLSFLKERHPELFGKTKQFDCTFSFPDNTPRVDLAYTHAVIMHIKAGSGHLVALSNLFRVATKQVILMENWKRHGFMKDIKLLFSRNVISWRNIHFYYRESEELKKPHLMVISSYPLKQYPELIDYKILENHVYDEK